MKRSLEQETCARRLEMRPESHSSSSLSRGTGITDTESAHVDEHKRSLHTANSLSLFLAPLASLFSGLEYTNIFVA